MERYTTILYHEINDEFLNKYSVRKEDFLNQLKILKNCQIVGSSIERINRNNDLQKSVAITFDDGFFSDLWAAEKLANHGFSATFFLINEFLNSQNQRFLDRENVKEISEMGHEIGVHGHDHKWWTQKSIAQLIQELSDTKKYLEDITGKRIKSCSAVGGKLNREIVNAISENEIFEHIRSTFPWYTERNAILVNGTAILRNDSDTIFERKIIGCNMWYNYSSVYQRMKDQVKLVLNK